MSHQYNYDCNIKATESTARQFPISNGRCNVIDGAQVQGLHTGII